MRMIAQSSTCAAAGGCLVNRARLQLLLLFCRLCRVAYYSNDARETGNQQPLPLDGK